MAITNKIKNQHLINRAGFGPMIESLIDFDKYTAKQLWQLLVKTSSQAPAEMSIATDPRKDKAFINEDGTAMNYKQMDATTKKLIAFQYRNDIKNMNIWWLTNMVNSKAQLRHKLTFFWHGHFACRSRNALFSQQLFNIIQQNALGNFGTMLRQVSKSPAMLQFLNNQQNRKGHPNENFAREVMELFTIGRGNYTEADVKEAARAFTGWSFDKNGAFIFRPILHDNFAKNVLGNTGNFNGDDVLDIILKKPETAYFICKKIYQFFVNENIDEILIKKLATNFYNNNYEIAPLLEEIFTSEWFYEQKNMAIKIKSPIELIVGIRRFLPLELENDEVQLLFQKVLGQLLFYPPNVAGWPGGRSWIDSSTLMVRLQIPQALSNNDALEIKPKTDDDTDMGMVEQKNLKIGKNKAFSKLGVSAHINWSIVFKAFENIARPQLEQALISSLILTSANFKSSTLQPFLNIESRDSFIKSVIINVMSTPEYQLC